MRFSSFESLRVWHEARRLTSRIYCGSGSGEFSRDFAFRDQIRRASISVMSNIAEGCERTSRKEFAHFLSVAKGSIGEVRSQLYAAEDLGYLQPDVATDLRLQAKKLARGIAALLKEVRRSVSAADSEKEK